LKRQRFGEHKCYGRGKPAKVIKTSAYCSDWRYPATGTQKPGSNARPAVAGSTAGGYDRFYSTGPECEKQCRARLPTSTSFYLLKHNSGFLCGCSATTSGPCKTKSGAGYTSYLIQQGPAVPTKAKLSAAYTLGSPAPQTRSTCTSLCGGEANIAVPQTAKDHAVLRKLVPSTVKVTRQSPSSAHDGVWFWLGMHKESNVAGPYKRGAGIYKGTYNWYSGEGGDRRSGLSAVSSGFGYKSYNGHWSDFPYDGRKYYCPCESDPKAKCTGQGKEDVKEQSPEPGCTYGPSGSRPPGTECVCNLRCPPGMKRWGDGSACEGGGKQCDLGGCHGHPNRGLVHCDELRPKTCGQGGKSCKKDDDCEQTSGSGGGEPGGIKIVIGATLVRTPSQYLVCFEVFGKANVEPVDCKTAFETHLHNFAAQGETMEVQDAELVA